MQGSDETWKTTQLSEHVRRGFVRFALDGGAKREVVVDRRLTVGAADGADFKIDDPTVSRLHAELVPRADGVWVRDLGSRNGTFVNDVRVVEARVGAGDRLRVGKTTLRTAGETESLVPLWSDVRFGRLIGRSEPMRELFARLAKVAGADLTVLLQGESGTGKELAAESIHLASTRAEHPFVVVDCAALPEHLLDAELFGHTRGAFTGAVDARRGAVEEADGGTLFLDEIGELPLEMQPKLLRLLESRTVRPVGDHRHRKVDVRFIAATNRDLRAMVNQGTFREDLYFRLSVVTLDIPPLRDRREDVPLLIQTLAPDFGAETEALIAHALSHPWPGNVRELRNYVERARALGLADALDSKVATPHADVTIAYKAHRDAALESVEREYFGKLLAANGHNVSACARIAGVNRTWLHDVIRKHGL